MKRVIFLDRDGTLIFEPEVSQQVDSVTKLKFIPGVISALRNISLYLKYELVIVTNQDGLGTEIFPEETFWPAHNLMLDIFQGEGVIFKEVLIDRSLESEQLPTRKPGTGLLKRYLEGDYNLARSYFIGDRASDVAAAKNLGAKAIRFSDRQDSEAIFSSNSWLSIYEFLRKRERCAHKCRVTAETSVKVEISLLGTGKSQVHTGIGFFDHMLDQLARHSGADIKINVEGDLDVDEHHTIEDTAIVLGEAVREALGSKLGIARYGFILPMDDALARVAIDLSNRPWIVWKASFQRERIGEMPTEMFFHFFKSFSDSARCNLNISAEGENEHHKIEAIFKAFAKALSQAWNQSYERALFPSTKEVL